MARIHREFIAEDPGNSNVLEGIISRERSVNYGRLTIKKVNGEKVNYPPILGTPKLGYPFTRGGNFQFPSADEILCFKKYDGSNILAYRYWDAAGKPYIAYKVRVWPFLRGKMIPMWQRMLARYPAIPKLFALNPDIAAFSFEMFGAEHPHLIKYETALDTVLLFGLKRNGDIVIHRDIDAPGIPKAELLKEVKGDYVWEYTQMQEAFGAELTLIDAENQVYTGEEGAVWYVKEKRSQQWKLLKCKPRQIELTHWTTVPLTREMLRATGLNILTEYPEITLEVFKDYLAEEYPPHQIEESLPRIKAMMTQLNVRHTYTPKIRALLRQHGFDASTDEKTIMRAFASEFPRNKMGHVYRELQYVLQQEMLGVSS